MGGGTGVDLFLLPRAPRGAAVCGWSHPFIYRPFGRPLTNRNLALSESKLFHHQRRHLEAPAEKEIEAVSGEHCMVGLLTLFHTKGSEPADAVCMGSGLGWTAA